MKEIRTRRYQHPKQVGIFLLLSIGLFLMTDLFLMGGYDHLRGRSAYSQTTYKVMPDEHIMTESEILDFRTSSPMAFESMTAHQQREQELMRALENKVNLYSLPGGDPAEPLQASIAPEGPAYESWKGFAIPAPGKTPEKSSGRPKIVIIIDDLGMNQSSTRATIALPGPLTLAFLPYAPQLKETTALAREKGHELLIHMPMEPLNPNLNPGPLALKSYMTRAEFDLVMNEMLNAFDGYVGINNHMGSKLTQNPEKMDWVMEALEKRGLIFVDSMTISSSVALDYARAHNLHYAHRDIFLDHEASREFVLQSLADLESLARKKGVAVAIGHPKVETLKALAEWLPGIKDKGFDLVAVSDVVVRSPVKDLPKIAAEAGADAAPEKPTILKLFGPVQKLEKEPLPPPESGL